MAPVLLRWLPIADIPVDFGVKFRGEPIFGQHKTYRGFIVGILSSVAIVYVQKLLYPYTAQFALLDYSQANIWFLGFILGGGALLGDLIKSFFKRQFHISSGKSWVPFDQIDWIVGALIAGSLVIELNHQIAVVALVLFGILHPIINIIGYYSGLKNNRF